VAGARPCIIGPPSRTPAPRLMQRDNVSAKLLPSPRLQSRLAVVREGSTGLDAVRRRHSRWGEMGASGGRDQDSGGPALAARREEGASKSHVRRSGEGARPLGGASGAHFLAPGPPPQARRPLEGRGHPAFRSDSPPVAVGRAVNALSKFRRQRAFWREHDEPPVEGGRATGNSTVSRSQPLASVILINHLRPSAAS
jgi:hypothetical protein